MDTKEKLFETGKILMTPGAQNAFLRQHVQTNIPEGAAIAALLVAYTHGDWGEVDEEDWETNDQAVKNGQRILASYELFDREGTTIWIITEWDRSVTTFLLPSEY